MTKGHTDPTPETSHRGYPIRYGINSDRWTCNELNLEAEKLSTLKGQIDRAIRRFNEDGIQVVGIQHSKLGKVFKVVATRMVNRNRLKPGSHLYEWRPVREVDAYGSSYGDRPKLHKNQDMAEFAPDNPTTHQMLAEHERLVAAAEAARRKADDYLATIPRITEADIAELIPTDPPGDHP
jgi:hypothetical protein